MRLNAKQILQCCGGRYIVEPIDPSKILTGFTWDSRDVVEDSLFVALVGENVDGHIFITDALSAGAACVLVNDAPDGKVCLLANELGAGIIEVPNTYHAVEDLARFWRGRINANVVAITGSVGKTTTKNLIRDVLSAKFNTVATIANQNNELGVPNTILAADPDTQVIIVEMGMRGRGQITHLCDIARPNYGVITNVGECHMELLGSKEAIIQAKAELLCALPDGSGRAFLNAEDDSSQVMVESENLIQREVGLSWFGCREDVLDKCNLNTSNSVSCWYEDLSIDGEGRPSFTLCVKRSVCDEDNACCQPALFGMEPDIERENCRLSVRGAHNALNACAAACVGISLGMGLQDVVYALAESVGEAGRLETLVSREGFLVINDAYNANPDSMRAALKMLSSMDITGKRVAVLGDMGELGDIEIECHKGIGHTAAKSDIDMLICVGELSSSIAQGALDAGMQECCVKHVDSVGDVLGLLEGALTKDDVVLVKASHFMRLDRLAEGLVS